MALPLLAALLLFLAYACGDDEAGDGADRNGATATPTEPAGDGEQDGGDAPDAGDSGDSDLSARLKEIGTDWGSVRGRITYAISDPASGSMTLSLYQDPPHNSRIDLLGQEGEGDAIIINTAEASFFCTASGGQGFCVKSAAEEGVVPGFFTEFSDPRVFEELESALRDIDTFDDKIAGVGATCFRASGSRLYLGEDGTATWCFSASGLLLLAAFEGDAGSFRMEATGVGDVSAADFEPPFELMDLGGS